MVQAVAPWGRCFTVCNQKGSHIPPTTDALATVTAALEAECSPS